jgi:REP element-mobilizing transposase RayT
MRLNELGRIANREWFKTSELRSSVELQSEEFVVIPNHVHGIIWIHDRVGAERRSAPTSQPMVARCSLGAIVRAYKSAVTYAINAWHGTRGEAIWQRNYYEHILRDQSDWEHACHYIHSNPSLWEDDEEHPTRSSSRGE